MAGLLKVFFALILIAFVFMGTIAAGLLGFIFTLLIAVVLSSMVTRIEKNKLEDKKHKEMLAAIKKSNK